MKAILLVAFVFGLGLVHSFPANSTEVYPYTETLVDGSYILYWKHNNTHITFETHVKTLGWVGFGISENGNMYPADVVIGWVKNRKTFLEDRHAVQYDVPIMDDTNDWTVVFGSETNDTTVLKFVRALDTCDTEHDKPITKNLMHVIFAWNDNDPEPDLQKHTRKGTKVLYLLDPITPDVTLPSDAKSFMFSSVQARIPPQLTYYHCTAYVFPAMKSKQHVIAFEPVIQPGNEDIVHHAVLMTCPHPFPDSDNGTAYDCSGSGPPTQFQDCFGIFTAWATGGQTFYLPDNVGMTIGDASGPRYYVFQVHYNNAKYQTGRIDSSGLRAVYTSQLRPLDAGTLEVGVTVSPLHLVPPHYNAFISEGYCTSECLSQGMTDGSPIYLNAVFLHSHLLGRKLRLRHIRDGVELQPISEDNSYNFDFQQTRVLRTPVKVKPTDTLIMECVYDSSDKVNVTTGGLGTEEEMCLAFVSYYPKMTRLETCLSVPTYNNGHNFTNIYREAFKLASGADWGLWKSVWDRQQFQCFVGQSEHMSYCAGGEYKDLRFIPVPTIKKHYVPESACPATPDDSVDNYKDWCDLPSATTANQAAALLIVAAFLSMYL